MSNDGASYRPEEVSSESYLVADAGTRSPSSAGYAKCEVEKLLNQPLKAELARGMASSSAAASSSYRRSRMQRRRNR